MNGILLNMIHRQQGTVDKVQPRQTSMFEPEPAPIAAKETAFTPEDNEIVNESPVTGIDTRSKFIRPSNIDKTNTESPPLAALSVMLQKPAQADEGFAVSGLNSHENNRLDLISGQIQNVLARMGSQPEPPASVNNPGSLKKSLSAEISAQTVSKVVSNETRPNEGIEELLKRLTTQNSNLEANPGLLDHGQLAPANMLKKTAEPLLILPAQAESKGGKQDERLIKSINDREQPFTAPISTQNGFLQTPSWLTSLQTELSNRWRQSNDQSQAESVINVTIGRVEVRAVNAEPAKTLAARKKPAGILSLNDYLKQRDNKGRT